MEVRAERMSRARTPWERDDAGFADMFRSWMEVMTEPFEFFERLDVDVPFARPLLFFLVFWVVGSGLGSLATQAALGDWAAETYAREGLEQPDALWNLFYFFLSPFLGVLALGLNIVFVHVGVRLFVKDARPLGVTARGLCYSVAPQVAVIIPFLGWLVAAPWSLFLAVAGVRTLHGTSTGRAVAAVFVPQLVFWFTIGMLFFFFVVVVLLAVGGAA